eukprot:211761-Rhodomonas_salina.1
MQQGKAGREMTIGRCQKPKVYSYYTPTGATSYALTRRLMTTRDKTQSNSDTRHHSKTICSLKYR